MQISRKFHLVPVVAVAVAMFGCLKAGAQPLYTSGHADLGIAYEGGEWDLHVHAEGAMIDGTEFLDQEFEADDVIINVPESVKVVDQNTSELFDIPESLGLTQGEPFWNLMQNLSDADMTDSPFLGMAAEEVDPADFDPDSITIALTGFSGPGEFTLWTDGTGVQFDTLDGLGSDDELTGFPIGTGAHTHFNYAFSAPGTYNVTLTASGTLTGGGPTSGSGTYTFRVVPEPGTIALFGLGGACLAGVVIARRRKNDRKS